MKPQQQWDAWEEHDLDVRDMPNGSYEAGKNSS